MTKKIFISIIIAVMTATAGLLLTNCKKDNEIHVTDVKLNFTEYKLGVDGELKLVATVQPEDAKNKDVTFESSNPCIAKVTASGLVTGLMKGNATITVTTKDGNKTAQCKLQVATIPVLKTFNATDITDNSARLHGKIVNTGIPEYTERGVCYSTTTNLNIGSSSKKDEGGSGTGDFFVDLTGLNENKIYYARAYAINNEGPVYGETVRFFPSKIEMVIVDGGTFTMGCTEEQGNDCKENETPSHQVKLSTFLIGKYEVTLNQWNAVMESDNNQNFIKGDDLPVTKSWDEVQIFITKLNQQTGKKYRLPTEAEWEFAARGGNKSKGYKYSGSNDVSAVAWYINNSGYSIHPVGSKKPNELGIYDMNGNLWEWCKDKYGVYSESAKTNPAGPSSGVYRVLRGGSWHSDSTSSRVSRRSYYRPHLSWYSGFRLALSSD